MKYSVVITLFVMFFFSSCQESAVSMSPSVASNDNAALYKAIANAGPGDNIVLSNGTWKDLKLEINNSGTEDSPITISAETPGKVIIEGKSNLQLGGDYIVVDGLYFTNGSSPSNAVIHFAVKDTVANHCRVTNCVIKDFNQAQRNKTDLWILMKGRHNKVDHCYLTGKSNRGPTLRVDLEGNPNINNYHQIVKNHFGPRPPKGGPSAETIQIGNSYTSMSPSYTYVADNLFDECNGEVEIISSKTNFNEFRNNVFYKSEGSLVTRHGNYCIVDGNYFIGDETESNVGGVRLIGTGHVVTNNYFYNLRGSEFRSPLAVMNGIPKSPLNRYIQVTDVVVAHNSWINCVEPLQFGVGSNVSMRDVLPASEIRSDRPIRTTVANNLIYNKVGDKQPIVAHDKLDGINFQNNLINNQGVPFTPVKGVEASSFELKEIAEYIWAPSGGFPDKKIFAGFGFEQFNKDLFGGTRDADHNSVGALLAGSSSTSAPPILDRSKYGTDWFDTDLTVKKGKTIAVKAGENVAAKIATAVNGDIIDLGAGDHTITAPLKLDKTLTIQSNAKANILYTGPAQTPLFEMNPNAKITLKGLNIKGSNTQYAFASLKENMSSLYNLTVDNCVLENFDYLLRGYKYSFSEHIVFTKSTFRNFNNGLEMSEEIEDKGEYNAENITIDGCTFDGVKANVIDYYRGGYDESTVGGNLVISNSTFTNSGAGEKNGTLLNTYGIINVALNNNTFKNNSVKRVALLWGAKNNTHTGNTVTNSGKIVTEENLKLKTFY